MVGVGFSKCCVAGGAALWISMINSVPHKKKRENSL